ALGVVRVEIDGEEQEILLPLSRFAEIENVLVPGIIEAEIGETLESRVLAPEPVHEGDVRADMARPVPVPGAELVFLGIEIFLAVRQRRRLAELEARIDAVIGAERGCEHEPRAETGPPAPLQEVGIDV